MATTADLLIAINANISQASAQIAALNGQLDSLGSGVVGRGDTLAAEFEKARPAAMLMVGAGLAIEGAFAGAVGTAASFEAAMSGIKSVMSPGDVAKFGDALTALALTLGKETVYSAKEAARGIEELVKAGIPAADILNGVGRAALDLAAATGVPVSDAARLAAAAMNAFQKSAVEIPGVMDFMAGTVNATAADMTDLGYALQASANMAALVGMSFEDTATALGLFANYGLIGSDAGTSLKTMLAGLEPKTKKAKALFEELGITTGGVANKFFDAEGSFAGLANMSVVLGNALKGMTDEQKMATLYAMFGSDAIRAASIVARAGAEDINALKTEIAGMTVAQMAAIRLDNMRGSLEQLKGSVETAAITIGMAFLPYLRAAVDWLTQWVNWFISLDPQIQKFAALAAAAAGGVALLVGGFVLLAPMIAALPGSFAAIGSILGTVAGALGSVLLPVLAIGAAAAALYLTWTDSWGGVVSAIQSAVPAITDGVQRIWDRLSALAVDATTWLGNAWAKIDWSAVWARVQFVVSTAWLAAVSVVSEVTAWLGRQWAAIPWAQVWATVTGIGQGLVASAQNIYAEVATWLGQQWGRVDWAGVWASVTTIGAGLASAAVSIATSVTTWLGTQWSRVDWAAVWATVTGIGAGLVASALAIGTQVTTWLSAQWGKIDWAAVWAGAVAFASGLETRISELAAPVRDWLAGVWGRIDWNAIWLAATTFGQGLEARIRELLGAARDWLGGVWAQIDWNFIWAQVQGFGNGLELKIRETAPAVRDWFGGVWASIDWSTVWSKAQGFDTSAGNWIRQQPTPAIVSGFGEWLGGAIATALAALATGRLQKELDDFAIKLGVQLVTSLATNAPTSKSVQDGLFPQGIIGGLQEFFFNLGFDFAQSVGKGFAKQWQTLIKDAGIDVQLDTFSKAIDGLVKGALDGLAKTYIQPMVDAFNAIAKILPDINRFFGDLSKTLGDIKLPWFLTPGSPTPLETALRGLLDVLSLIARLGNPFEALAKLADIFGGDLGGTGTGKGQVVYLTGPLLYVETIGEIADAEAIVDALQDAFTILRGGAARTDNEAPAGQPGSGGGGSW